MNQYRRPFEWILFPRFTTQSFRPPPDRSLSWTTRSFTFAERNCCGSDAFDPSVTTVTCEIDDGGSSGGGSDINIAAVIGTVAAVGALVLVCCVARRLKTRKSKKPADASDAAKEPVTPPEIVAT